MEVAFTFSLYRVQSYASPILSAASQ